MSKNPTPTSQARIKMGLVHTSLRLSSDCKELIRRLSEATGLSLTGVVELAVRDLARHRGVRLKKAE